MAKSATLPALTWQPVSNWTNSFLIGLEASPGLLRFWRDSEIVYIAMETKSVANSRRFVTPGGSWKNHEGGRLVHKHRNELALEYALLDASRCEIEWIRDALIDRHHPRFNFPDYKPKAR